MRRDREKDEGEIDQELVREGIEHGAELGALVEAARDVAVNEIRNGRGEEYRKREVADPFLAGLVGHN